MFDVKTIKRKLKIPLQYKTKVKKGNYECYSHSHLRKGSDYHRQFVELPGRRMMCELEKEILYEIANEKSRFDEYLDFAGGTGRIAVILNSYCRNTYILDISKSMLRVAKETIPNAMIIEGDFRDTVTEIEDGSIDLITAFRFFPNAEVELRKDAIKFISRKLKRRGWLVCNNHKHFWSVPWLIRRLTLSGGTTGMSNGEMIQLGSRCKLRLVRRYSLGVLPQDERKAVFSWFVTQPVERFLYRHFGTSHSLGYNLVYVFEKL